ncbi:MAG: polyphosphate kinase 2 family protein [Lachnospiraceae bacterium]|nr:polyphosphate kinase 2 family protein [Lachnospiraceae bacterium]MBR2995365.1 polyphosphate kinase 2 family protein [Lachnospiraceae bacterium]
MSQDKLFKRYEIDGSEKVKLTKLPKDSKEDGVEKEEILAAYDENMKKLGELQERLYADGKEGLIIVLQAIDAAGKDSTIKHVMGGFNPQGVKVYSFKGPNTEELAHDYLWRMNKCLPKRGEISIWNRSHYEDVVAVEMHDLWDKYAMAARAIGTDKDEFIKKRCKQIRNYEEYLYENSYRVVKIFLNVSKKEQKKRFLERIERPEKNWKFSVSDMEDRAHFEEYVDVYEKTLNRTATKTAPWYALPADQKWYTRYLVSEILVHVLEDCDPQFPEVSAEQKLALQECKARLEAE